MNFTCWAATNNYFNELFFLLLIIILLIIKLRCYAIVVLDQ